MCGIAGFLHSIAGSKENLSDLAVSMGDVIAHRGPDDGQIWVDEDRDIGLVHRRLSIIDLSAAGAQPMISSCGQFIIVYNGEVYNTDELKKDLVDSGIRFRGHSDTEVILELCAKIGVAATAKKLIGMFAFALWNRRDQTLTLVRDRVGIKPLYWSKINGQFFFGSEIKALKQHPEFDADLDHDAVTEYLRFGYITSPKSIYKRVQKLEPGHILTVKSKNDPRIESFWSLDEVIDSGIENQIVGSDSDVTSELDGLIGDAVKRRMVSDVPLGAFLSGGIDSSLVACKMQEQSTNPIKTFSIGFSNDKFNEAVFAKQVAEHLGTEHTEFYVSSTEALDVLPKLPSMFDEPISDSSQIPTYLVSELTRKHVTVALSGDGGDELFTGYQRYFISDRYRKMLNQPAALRAAEAKVIEAISPATINKIGKLLPGKLRGALSGDKAYRLPSILRGGRNIDLYKSILSHSAKPEELVIGGQDAINPCWAKAEHRDFPDRFGYMQYIDSLTYLPDDILTKVDRASMAVSLEARVPLLDHRIVEYSWRLPHEFKVRNNDSKWILKNILYQYIPKDLIDRPKKGFGVPVGEWLKGPLKDWAEDLLSTESIKQTEILNPAPIRAKWEQHLRGDVNWEFHLWDILMLQSWLRNQAL